MSADDTFYVYILASKSGVLYTGITNDLLRRVLQHKHGGVPGFTQKYRVNQLVYFEIFGDPTSAIAREKQIKAYRRAKRIALIEARNPQWQDLTATLA